MRRGQAVVRYPHLNGSAFGHYLCDSLEGSREGKAQRRNEVATASITLGTSRHGRLSGHQNPQTVKTSRYASGTQTTREHPATYVWTPAGFCHVSFITDVYSRMILGWRVTTSKTTPLVLSALEQALFTRRRTSFEFTTDGLLHHCPEEGRRQGGDQGD